MSVSFYVANDAGEWVFTRDETNPGDWIWNEELGYEEEVPNPLFRPELDINLGNRNARLVLDALGYEMDEEGFWQDTIDTFINKARSYLRSTIGKQSKGFDDVVTTDGPYMVDCGLPTGYIEKQVHRLVVLAQEGKQRGATVIYGA